MTSDRVPVNGALLAPLVIYQQAKKLDELRSAPYWATLKEFFARAGAAYVADRLQEKGIRSDYLVYGADESCYADNPLGNPNPSGAERRSFAVHFAQLMDEYRICCIQQAEANTETEMAT